MNLKESLEYIQELIDNQHKWYSKIDDINVPNTWPLVEFMVLKESKICYDNKLYFTACSSLWMFLEFYLRENLIISEFHNKSHDSTNPMEDLNEFDKIEDNIEQQEIIKDEIIILKEKILQSNLDQKEKNTVIQKLNSKRTYNEICKELTNKNILTNDLKKQLISYYGKYRNKVMHWLFGTLCKMMNNDSDITPIYIMKWFPNNIKTWEWKISKCHPLFRRKTMPEVYKKVYEECIILVAEILNNII